MEIIKTVTIDISKKDIAAAIEDDPDGEVIIAIFESLERFDNMEIDFELLRLLWKWFMEDGGDPLRCSLEGDSYKTDMLKRIKSDIENVLS